jgi:hypothetical protein
MTQDGQRYDNISNDGHLDYTTAMKINANDTIIIGVDVDVMMMEPISATYR